jgi:two-component system, chemotaxis family, protein-glutamate methylesterase/glutaminase
MPGHDIIVIGASAGGVEVLVALAGALPRNLPAAVFVVLHIPAHSPSLLPEILNRVGPLAAIAAADGMAIEHGHIYVAQPDHHTLVDPGQVRVVRGPKENRHRPAVDPLFRSAAQAYGPRVVGVVLTGSLDDGTAGLHAIKRRGGIAVVQDPNEALYPSMPLSALENVAVDYTLPLSGIGPVLVRLANEPVPAGEVYPVPEDMEMETRLTEMDLDTLYGEERAGTPSSFSCPECGGVLWELQDGDLLRFRCRIGHAFTVDSVLAEQSEVVEGALWAALKTLEETVSLSSHMARQAHGRGQDWLARRFAEKVREAEQHAKVIRELLLKGEMEASSDVMSVETKDTRQNKPHTA